MVETYDVPIEFIPFFEAKGDRHDPLELVLQRADVRGARGPQAGDTVRVQGIRIITAEPGPNPHIGRIQVGDIRWLFPYRRIWRQYNRRYRVANRKRGVWGADPNLQADVSQDQYDSWSLNPETGQPWEALDIILDVLENPRNLAQGLLFPALALTKIERGVEELRSISTENVLIDEDGSGALRRALALLPGVGFYIGYEGEPILYSKFDGRAEADQIGDMGPPMVDGGIVKRISNSTTRPEAVDVLVPRKVEVRFSYQPGFTLQGEQDARRLMENVILVVDPDFTDAFGNPVPQGEWLSADDYIGALIAQAGAIGAGRLKTFSQRILDQAMVPWMGIWSMIEAAGLDDLANAQELKYNFASRFGSLQQHYLQTFRLNPSWVRRSRLMEAKLVGVFDAKTGTRADSPVWTDYCVVPSMKAQLVGAARDQRFCMATNKYDYPGSTALGPGALDAVITNDAPPSPWRVDILDADQGLIRITPRGDVYANWETLVPAPMLNRPCYNPEAEGLPLSFDSVPANARDRLPRLDSDNARFTVVLTFVPATPNNTEQFHRIRVKPGDLQGLLTGAAARGLKNAKGPVQEVLVKDEFARVIWIDDPGRITIIHRMFDLPDEGVAIGEELVVPVGRLEAALATLNDDIIAAGDLRFNIGSGANLQQLALAEAAKIYAAEQDRLVGAQTAPLTPGLVPAGFLSEVTHVCETDGTMLTHVQLPASAPAIEVEAYLDDFTRKRLNKELGAK